MTSPIGAFFESLAGGFQAGSQYREHRDDRRRMLANEGEDREYQRARRLREEVGFGLEQRVRRGQLDAQGRATQQHDQRRAAIAQAATRMREVLQHDPKYKNLMLLPDEELVQQAGELFAHPERGAQERRARELDTRQDLASVERQVDDTRADLSRAERDAPVRTPMMEYFPALEQRFVADSTASAQRIDALEARADSLGGVRDSIAGVLQGRDMRTPAPAPSRAQGGRLMDWGRGYGARPPAAPAAAPKTVDQARSRARQLQAEGKSREEILRIMRAEGYNVQ